MDKLLNLFCVNRQSALHPRFFDCTAWSRSSEEEIFRSDPRNYQNICRIPSTDRRCWFNQ